VTVADDVRLWLGRQSPLFFIVGTASSLTYGMVGIVRCVVQATVGDHITMGVNTTGELSQVFADGDAPNRAAAILYSDYPDHELLSEILRSGAPVVACGEALHEVVRFLMATREINVTSALIVATCGLSALEQIAHDVRIFLPGDRSRLVRDVLREVGTLIGHELDDETLRTAMIFAGCSEGSAATFDEVINRFAPGHDRLTSNAPGSITESNRESALIAGLAEGYDAVIHRQRMREVIWPRRVFLLCDPPGMPADQPVALVGPARWLMRGPFFRLPAGLWNVEVLFEVKDCWSDNRLEVDVAGATVLAAATMVLPPQGVYACDLQVWIEAPMPIEVRVVLLTGAIEGELLLRDVAFRRVEEAFAEIDGRSTVALASIEAAEEHQATRS
jgi:hypothetical protein